MRALLAGELEQAQNYSSDYYVRLEVQNADGTWIDVGAALGTNWITNATWGADKDTQVSQATFTLVQRVGEASLAPLMSASVLNVDDLGAYAPLLNIGRLIRASTATMAAGVELDVAKYRSIFTGRIDDVNSADAQPDKNFGPITIVCSDLGAWLMDLQIETSGTEYGDPDTPPTLEAVLQSVINDNIPAGEPAVTLVKQSASTFGVTVWNQGETKLMEALGTLVADSVGEDLRYRFDANHVSQLMWFNPDRSRVTVDATFGASGYILRSLDLAIRDIRNAGELSYTDAVTGATETVVASSAASISEYRRRFFRLPSSTMLSSEAEAQTVIDAVVSDLGQPPAEASAELPYFWPVQLYDRYTFTANNRQYDDDQTFAVGGYQHTIENGRGSTTLTVTARVVGAYARWLRKVAAGIVASGNPPAPPSLAGSFNAAGEFVLDVILGERGESFRVAVSASATPSDATVDAATPVNAHQSNIVYATPVIDVGETIYGKLISYTKDDALGLASDYYTFSATRQAAAAPAPPFVRIQRAATSTYGYVRVIYRGIVGEGGSGVVSLSRALFYGDVNWNETTSAPVDLDEEDIAIDPFQHATLTLTGTDEYGQQAHHQVIIPPAKWGSAGGMGAQGMFDYDSMEGQLGIPGARAITQDYYNATGELPLINPETGAVTEHLSAPDGRGPIESVQQSNRTSADASGAGAGHVTEGMSRSGEGGIFSPGGRLFPLPLYTSDGTTVLVNTETNRMTDVLEFPGGMASDTAEGYATRAGTGLDGSGVVQLDVPLVRAVANVPGISSSDGKVDDTVEISGSAEFIVSTGDAVAVLTDGATVTEGASRGNTGLDASGVVQLSVPRPHAIANIPAIGAADGKLLDTQTFSGSADFPVGTGDAVSILADGATVTANAERGDEAQTKIETDIGAETMEHTKGAERKAATGAGAGAGHVTDGMWRSGEGGVYLPGGRLFTLPIYDETGETVLFDPDTRTLRAAQIDADTPVEKTVELSHAAFSPTAGGFTYNHNANRLINSVAGSQKFIGLVPVPQGCTITKIALSSKTVGAGTGDITLTLERPSHFGAGGVLATATRTGINFDLGGDDESSTISSEMSGSLSLFLNFTAQNQEFYGCKVHYSMSSYDKGI